MRGMIESEAERHPGTVVAHRSATERVIAAMREQVDGALSLHAMAEIAHLSPYHFARTFRQVTGIPPGEFLTAVRLQKAKQLLLTTDLGVAEICFEVGYSSLGTFTSRFTNLVGVPPGRMRRLPEEIYPAFERVREGELAPPTALQGRGVDFRISGPDLDRSLIFAGLFPGAIPQCRPVVGTILTAPGTYRLAPPDGRYHLMAAALPLTEDPLNLLMSGAALRVGRGQSPVVVQAGRSIGRADVEMRAPRATDPPILVCLPALLLERLGDFATDSKIREVTLGNQKYPSK